MFTTGHQLELIADLLSNDEYSSDDELRDYLRENVIADHHIEQAISFRSAFLTDPLIELALDEKDQLTTVKTVIR